MDADLTEAYRDLKDKVDEARAELPAEVDNDPIVTKISADSTPIISLSLAGPLDPAVVSDLAEDLQDELETVAGVQEAVLSGQATRQFRVELEKSKLDGFGLSATQVLGAIRAHSLNFPLGSVEVNETNYTIRLENEIDSPEELGALPVFSTGKKTLRLRDLGKVEEGFAERNSISRLSVGGEEPKAAVSISIVKSTGANILKTVARCREVVANFPFPPGVEVVYALDLSEFVAEDFARLGSSAWQAVLIILAILAPFLGWRLAGFASLSIPLAFLITFFILLLVGETLNSLTLFSLVLALGIMVDVAVVIVEGFHEGREKGWSPQVSATSSVETFKLPIISGTATTIAVFVPMMMMTGIMGEYMSHIPITVTAALSSSLFVALTVLPMLLSRWTHQ